MRPLGAPLQLEKRRLRAIELLRIGKPHRWIAAKLNASLSSVVRWQQAFRKAGRSGLKPLPAPGRPALLSAGQKRQLARILLKSPLKTGYSTDLWTLSRVRREIENRFGVRYSLANVWNIMIRLGWSCQKPVKRARERDEKAIAHWKRYRWPHIKKRRKTWRPSGLPRRKRLPSGPERGPDVGA
jgi:transposase